MKLDPKDPLAAQLANVIFVVDATSTERHMLWREYNRAVQWKDDRSGIMLEIGKIDDMPVVIALNWAYLNGQKVMFVEATSQVVDYRMVDAWLEANCNPRWDNNHRTARTNAMNFGHCLQGVVEVSGVPTEVDEFTTLVSVNVDKETDRAGAAFDAQVKDRPSLVYQDTGWTLRAAFIAGWLAGLRRRLMRG